jgi:hypothetical protein
VLTITGEYNREMENIVPVIRGSMEEFTQRHTKYAEEIVKVTKKIKEEILQR